MDATRLREWVGREAVDPEGQKIGTIEEIYLDEQTGRPEWAAITTGWFGTKQHLVPLEHANESAGGLQLPYGRDQIKDAPNFDLSGGELSQDEESRLYRHYGLSYGESRSGTGLPEGGHGDVDEAGTVGRDTSGPTTDQAMTRSEEELRVGTTQRQGGQARLRKWVETEPVSEQVTTRREQARVVTEPITDANVDRAMDGPEISSEEHEVTLMQEEAVAEKRVVPKERVRLEKDVVEEQQTVTDELRKERIAAEGDLADGGTTR